MYVWSLKMKPELFLVPSVAWNAACWPAKKREIAAHQSYSSYYNRHDTENRGDAFEKKLGKLKWKGFFSDKLSCSLNNDLAIDPKNLSLESYPCLFFCFSPISGRDCHTLLDVYGSILLRLCATKAFTFPNSGGLCGALAPSYCLAKVYSRDEGIQSVNSLIFPHPARLQQQLHHQLQFGKIND